MSADTNGGAVGWDLAILGAGSAAFAAAITARDAGARVVMIEQTTVGGTCVNVGCVPSKALIAAADTYHRGRTHGFAGIARLGGARPDLAAIVARKDQLVAGMRQTKYLDLAADYGFELRRGTGRFVDEATLSVDGEPLTAGSYLIATGAHPAVPPIDGLAAVDYLTSTSALDVVELPRRLAVIGASAIGLELGQAFAHLGSEVTFLDVAGRIAPFEEPEISAALTDVLTDVLTGDGARVVTGARTERVSPVAGGMVLQGELGGLGSTLEVDRVLVATGRAPNTADLGLDAAGVDVDDRGFVIVNGQLRATNARVWAAGDVTASPQFVYVAAANVPRVTFTTPPVAAVGATEAEAVAAGFDVTTAVLPLAHVPRATVNGDTRGLIKLVADRSTGRLIGVHVLGDGAGDVIQAGVYALMAGMTTAAMAEAYHPYLTMAEGLKLAAQAFSRDVTRLSCCAA